MTRAHPGTKVCRKCGQSKPTEDFPEHEHTDDGFAHICLECWGGQGYIDEDAKASTPPLSSSRLIRIHGLDIRERQIADAAAERVVAYLTWDGGGSWDERSAEDVVDRHMQGASGRRKAGVLAVALRLADEEMGQAREDAA